MYMRVTCSGILALALVVGVSACGGGGNGGFAGATPAISLESTLLPQLASGQSTEFALPIQGGCGGPYTIRVISGELPDGLRVDDRQADITAPGDPAAHRHHLLGTALEEGDFPFTLEITDRGCRPFVAISQAMTWSIERGAVTIVDATPAAIPVALYNDPLKYPDVDALDKTVYGSFVSTTFVIAGGVAPYTCAVLDDPTDPDDDAGLPLGVVMPPASCSFVGSPQQVGAGGKPFRITVRATDSVGQSTTRKFQWKIDTPPMIVGSTSLANGTAGVAYGEAIQIVDGVPPFSFEFTADLPNPNDNVSSLWTYAPPLAPVFPSVSGFTVSPSGSASNQLSGASYPAPAATGPYYPAPPEGLYMIETGGQAGSISGVPRRYGTFTVNVHAHSSTVPNERGQHAFAQFTFNVSPGTAFVMRDTWLVDGDGSNTFLANTSDGVGTMPEFEVSQPKVIQMVAQGGVPFDGWTDAPHRNQRLLDLGEVEGTYNWSVLDWDSRAIGWWPGNSPAGRPTGIEATITGLIQTTNGGLDLVRQGRQVIRVAVNDVRLPVPTSVDHEVALSVGPDVVIITDSNQSCVMTTGSQYDCTAHGDSMFIKKLQIINNTAQKSPLDATDMAATHVVPAAANLGALSNPLGRLLSGVGKTSYTGTGRDAGASDILRINVNPGGWWDDTFYLNPKGARTYQHGDSNRAFYEYYAEYFCYGANPETTCVALPDITDGSVVANVGTGVYTNGGKLYAFENDTHFGVFVIREEGKIYVPFAMEKGTFTGFGDGVFSNLLGTGAGASNDGQMRIVHMGVSPNGRFAAMKIKASQTNFYETSSQSRIVLMDLAGTKAFGGDTYRIVSAPTSGGYLHADTLTLTNEFLYGTVGWRSPNDPYGWLQHNVFRESIVSGSGTALFAPGLPSNTSSTYLSLPYHNIPTSYYSGSWNGSPVYSNYYFYSGGGGTNRLEDDSAPTPFRVSADGTTCALMAGPYTGTVTGSGVFGFYAFVDKNGAGFQYASSTARMAPYGATRAHRVRYGPMYYGYAGNSQWGKNEGPSGNLEVSDDGNRVAFGYCPATSFTGSWYSSYSCYYYTTFASTRMDVVTSSTTNNWSSFSETAITAPFFGGSHKWRFGGLSFSRDGNRLFFFGGISQQDALGTTDYPYPSTSTRNASLWTTGTYYVYDFSGSTPQVRSVMPTSAGGTGSNTYTASSPFNPTSASITANWGVILPFGGFWSQNGTFLYILAAQPLTSSNATPARLVGINTGTSTINGKLGNAGFEVGNWPTARPMLPFYQPFGLYYGGMIPYLAPGGTHNFARIKMAEDTGVVFFATHSQRYSYNGGNYGQVYTQYYSSSYCKDAGNVECFASNVGGDIQRLTNFSNDGTTSSPRGRGIHYIEVNDAGDRLLLVYDIGSSGSANEYLRYQSNEGVVYVAGIQFSANGTLTNKVQTQLEGNEGQAGGMGTGVGRAGSAMAFGTDGQRVFYSFGPGAGDENQRKLAAPLIDGAGNVNGTSTTRYGSGARENVLHAGR
jgi:hypothetical protein